MFLRSLSLENIRSIEKMEMDFTGTTAKSSIRQWTLLLGQNWTGKSTVLKSIGLLLAGSDSLTMLANNSEDWIRNGAEMGTISGVVENQKGETRAITLNLKRGMRGWDLVKYNQEGLEMLDAALKHSDRSYFTAGYGACRRLPTAGSSTKPSRQMSEYSRRAAGLASLYFPNVALNSLEDWAVDLHYRKGSRGLDSVRSALEGLLPGMTMATIDKNRKQLLFATPDGDVPLASLSDGYQNMAAWCGDLLYRITSIFEERKKPLETGGLLLIDEIDLHLHPVWQRQILAYLTNKLPNFQIVATTHSPLTAQQAGPCELHLLEREEGTGAPKISRYQGVPREMRIEDLVVSPWFGLQTGYSLEIENKKKEYETLKKQGADQPAQDAAKGGVKKVAAKKMASPKASSRLAELKRELTEVTKPVRSSRIEKSNEILLQKLSKAISAMDSKKK